MVRVLVRIGVGLGGFLLAAAAYNAAALALERHRFPAPGRLVDVGGHRLHLYCLGEGQPTVVIEAAGGGASTEWDSVLPAVAQFTRVCVYDRAGYGWSDAGPGPRTSGRVADELSALLANADVRPPYVLVGHSLGGVNVRMFARRHAKDVAGLVLVDSSHEDQLERLPGEALVLRRQVRAFSIGSVLSKAGLIRLAVALGMRFPGYDQLSPAGRAVFMRPCTVSTLRDELASVPAGLAEARLLARPLGDRPLVVLSRGLGERGRDPGDAAERTWRQLQTDLAALSTNSRHVIAERSGHYIHVDEPELVVDAIRWVVEQARGGG